jgi:hypothetical protein
MGPRPCTSPPPRRELSKRHQDHDLKHHPGSVDLITTIQNKTKQTTFFHR